MKTLGGRQLWGDVAVFHEWRIQKNILTGHYRLLDGDDFRHVSGTFEECRQKLEDVKKQKGIPRMSGKAVILVHGIIRSSKSFGKMRSRFQQEGYHAFCFDYPSTRVTIAESAEFLHRVIESMDGIDEINFVVHSMGGLVVRAYLAEHHDERIRRMVMVGVPNLGAAMADRVQGIALYKAIFGPAGRQLVRDPGGFIAKLPTPDFEFAIIAGARGSENGYNFLIPGDDDGTVGVDSTRLPGAADFIAVRGIHSFLPGHHSVIDHSLRFVKEGRLRENGEPQPIPKTESELAVDPEDSSSTIGGGSEAAGGE